MAKDTETSMPGKGEVATDLRGLKETLGGDLTKLAGPKAQKAIAKWEALLAQLPGVKSISGDLGKLREHLAGGEPDGKAIAKLLGSLSTKTSKVAEDTGGVVGTALKSVAGALDKASGSLTDGASKTKTAKKTTGSTTKSSTSAKRTTKSTD